MPFAIIGNRLYKREKLCSHTAVEQLFASGRSVFAYPLRAQYAIVPARRCVGEGARFMITIPKRQVRRAVERMTLRRRVREAYRLCRCQLLLNRLSECGVAIDLALIYIAPEPLPYTRIEAAMHDVLRRVVAEVEKTVSRNSDVSKMP